MRGLGIVPDMIGEGRYRDIDLIRGQTLRNGTRQEAGEGLPSPASGTRGVVLAKEQGC